MAGWNGVFYNGVWSCGMDFLPSSAIVAGGVFDAVHNAPTVGAASARFTGKGCLAAGTNAWMVRSLNVNIPTCIPGFAFQTTSLPTGSGLSSLITLADTVGNAAQCSLAYDVQGKLGLYQTGVGFGTPATLIGSQSAAGVIIPGAYNYIEMPTTIDPVSGSIVVYLNGNHVTPVISFSGNTRVTANSWVNQVIWGVQSLQSFTHNFDDLYLLDGTGAAPYNAALGAGRIQTDGPNADSASGGLNAWAFTTPQGSDFANAANIPANPAQYNSDAVVNDRMSFRFPALSTTKVFFLNSWYSAEEDDAGVRTLAPIYRNGGVDQVGPLPVSLTGAYVYYNQPSTIDPNTSANWASGTVAAAGGCEIGLIVNS